MNLKELLAARLALFVFVTDLVTKAETEKRELTPDEVTIWDSKVAEIAQYDEKIKRAEQQEELNKRFAQQQFQKNPQKSPEEKLVEAFSLRNAFQQLARGGQLTGAEAEMNQEGLKEYAQSKVEGMANSLIIPSRFISIKTKAEKRAIAYVATGDGTPPIKTGAVDMLEIVRDELVMDKVGVTTYPNLEGNFKLPSMGQLSAAFVSEEAAVDTSGTALASDTLAPRRVGSGDIFTKELLSQTSPVIWNQILAEFVNAIYRAVEKDLFDAIAAGGTILSGHATTDTVAALDHAAILNLEKTLKQTNDMTSFVGSPSQRALLKALALGTSIRFAWDSDNTVNGYKAYATAALTATNGGSTNTAFDVILGNFKGAAVGSWGGVELIIDPYTYSANGAYKVTANALFDTGVANALHFAVIRNASA